MLGSCFGIVLGSSKIGGAAVITSGDLGAAGADCSPSIVHILADKGRHCLVGSASRREEPVSTGLQLIHVVFVVVIILTASTAAPQVPE